MHLSDSAGERCNARQTKTQRSKTNTERKADDKRNATKKQKQRAHKKAMSLARVGVVTNGQPFAASLHAPVYSRCSPFAITSLRSYAKLRERPTDKMPKRTVDLRERLLDQLQPEISELPKSLKPDRMRPSHPRLDKKPPKVRAL